MQAELEQLLRSATGSVGSAEEVLADPQLPLPRFPHGLGIMSLIAGHQRLLAAMDECLRTAYKPGLANFHLTLLGHRHVVCMAIAILAAHDAFRNFVPRDEEQAASMQHAA